MTLKNGFSVPKKVFGSFKKRTLGPEYHKGSSRTNQNLSVMVLLFILIFLSELTKTDVSVIKGQRINCLFKGWSQSAIIIRGSLLKKKNKNKIIVTKTISHELEIQRFLNIINC